MAASLLLIVFLLTSTLLVLHSFEQSMSEADDDYPVVSCETTQGLIRIEVYKDWAPLGAQRFLDLVQDGFFTDIALYRCVKRFLVQFGITEDPTKKHWHRYNLLPLLSTSLHLYISPIHSFIPLYTPYAPLYTPHVPPIYNTLLYRETLKDDPNLHKGIKKNYLSFAGGKTYL